MKVSTPKEIMEDAIMKHAGLSEFDKPDIEAEVKKILSALQKNGYVITKST